MREPRPLITPQEHKQLLLANPDSRPSLNQAIQIMAFALHGKRDRGLDRIRHYLHVAGHIESPAKRMIGILSGAVSEGGWTLDDLYLVGFPKRVVEGVDRMTQRPEEFRPDFIQRLSYHDNPKYVRDAVGRQRRMISNQLDNSDVGPFAEVEDQYLMAVFNGKIAPGSLMSDFMRSFRPDLYEDEDLLEAFDSTRHGRDADHWVPKLELEEDFSPIEPGRPPPWGPLIGKEKLIALLEENPGEDEMGLNTMLILNTNAFHGRKMFNGHDYIYHCLEVGRDTEDPAQEILGVGHDFLEDTDWTVSDLRMLRCPMRTAQGFDLITKREGELYFDYTQRINGFADEQIRRDVQGRKVKDNGHNELPIRNPTHPNRKRRVKQRVYRVNTQFNLAGLAGRLDRNTTVRDFMLDNPKQKLWSYTLLLENTKDPGPPVYMVDHFAYAAFRFRHSALGQRLQKMIPEKTRQVIEEFRLF